MLLEGDYMKLKFMKNLTDNRSNHYDLVNHKNAVKPNYELNKQQFTFEIYINYLGDICIVKQLDNNYICGLAFSTISDLARTQAIMDGMIENVDPLISTEYNVLGYRLDRNEWFHIRMSYVVQDGEFWLKMLTHISVHISSRCQPSYFAKQIQGIFPILASICEARLAGGLYIPILKTYYSQISKYERSDSEAPAYYHQMKPLIEVVVS